MTDTMNPTPQTMPGHQRSHGVAAVELVHLDGATRLARLRQQGSAKAILPKSHAAQPEIVFLNTSGGLTGGDTLAYRLDLGPGARAVATTQTAERAYASGGGSAEVSAVFSVGAAGHLDWLPQETILFQGAQVRRRSTVDLAGDASCLMLESVILGRAAMGETVREVGFSDLRLIRRDGRLVHVEPATLTGTVLGDRVALLGPAHAFASLVLVDAGAADMLAAVRAVLTSDDVTGGASALPGRLCVRLMATDAFALRRKIVQVLRVLRRDQPLPRVWQA